MTTNINDAVPFFVIFYSLTSREKKQSKKRNRIIDICCPIQTVFITSFSDEQRQLQSLIDLLVIKSVQQAQKRTAYVK